MIKINNMVVNQDRFPDGTLHLDLSKTSGVIAERNTLYWFYENDSELFTIICIKRFFEDNYGKNFPLYLEMKYLPHARFDRAPNYGDVFTLKYFCEIINSLNFAHIIVWDAHSNVGIALLNNVTNCPVYPFILSAIKNIPDNSNLVMFYPDEGAMKRYSAQINNPYAFGVKKRDWANGKILGLDIINKELVKDKDILIVDDICSRGGTFLYSAKALKEAGANKIYLYITHLEKTVLEGELWKEMVDNQLIECIFTPNPLGEFDERYVVKI